MNDQRLPLGSFVQIEKPQLQAILDRLRQSGYRTIGPQIADGAVVYGELESITQLPIGWIDRQDGGCYRLEKSGQDRYFDWVNGPHSLKNYIFPPRETILEGAHGAGGWEMRPPEYCLDPPLAVIGPRSCDLHALTVQDRVFLNGPFIDPGYKSRRDRLFLLAVNCRRAAATCFCHCMKTGPALSGGFDIGLFELDDCFVLEVGTELGGRAITAAEWRPCSVDQIRTAQALPRQLEMKMHNRSSEAHEGQPRPRHLDTSDIRELLMSNLEHPRWEHVAQRCLSCANCTMVCPTCFCNSVAEVTDLTGDNVRRERSWASCFTAEHSYMSSGVVRKTTQSRYRQWLTHKLATWHDQFGTSGCVGCGRCITWCPVGIDITEEVAAIRGEHA